MSSKPTRKLALSICWIAALYGPGANAALIAHYNFTSAPGGTATDESPGGNNDIPVVSGGLAGPGAPTWVSTVDGRSGVMNFANAGSLRLNPPVDRPANGTSFSVALWVKSDQDMTDSGFIDGRDPGGDDTVLGIRYDKAGFEAGGKNLLKAGITTSGGVQRLETSNETQSTDWQHLA